MVKQSSIAFLIILAGVGILFVAQYFLYQNSPEEQLEDAMSALEKKYAEDPYGGETPEETLRLFVDALKKGDTDLAAKYFVLDKQEQWREDLAKIKEKGLLGEMIEDVEKLEKTKETEIESFYVATNDKNIVSVQFIISKNPYSKKWKIYEP